VVVNVASVEALGAFKQEMAQCIASKAGVLGLTRALVRKYGRQGFRFSAWVPGSIKTPATLSVASASSPRPKPT
jgi:NAD(P)-dependent dehydrogenase (short-subunit alcohol dehydrogenase family)